MRTSLDISDDVLFAARKISRRSGKTMGKVISDLARQAFAGKPDAVTENGAQGVAHTVSEPLAVYGIQPLPKRGGVVSNELIDRLRSKGGV